MFSPKIVIINYFDELINQVDIDIENALKKSSNENQVLGDLKRFEFKRLRKLEIDNVRILSRFESQQNDENQTVDKWSESTKVVDYLNQVRMKTIEELKKAQEECLENYKLNSTRFNSLEEVSNESKIEEFKCQLFAEKFYFQVRLTNEGYNQSIFNLFTFVTDFYMSPKDIKILEIFINNSFSEISYFLRDSKPIFDEKTVLIGLLCEYLFENLTNSKYPNSVISVRKRDSLNIREIKSLYLVKGVKLNCSSIDLSKLECLCMLNMSFSVDIELEGLSSLEYLSLNAGLIKRFSARNLPSLNHLVLDTKKLTKTLSTELFRNLPNVSELEIRGVFSDIKLSALVNLEKLTISGGIEESFNFDLFKYICNHLKVLSICNMNIDQEKLAKLFQSHYFPNLLKLKMAYCDITKLEKKLFDRFPILKSLVIINPSTNSNKQLRIIENDAFSNLTNLICLCLHGTFIEAINQRHFSGLINLETLDLSRNQIESIEENSFSNLKNLTELGLNFNNLSTLNPKIFVGLENLETLKVSFNKLTYFDLSIFDYIPNIDDFEFSNNPIINRDEILNFNKQKNEIKTSGKT